jgi:hypothetical protein
VNASWAVIFEVNIQQGNSKILWLLPQVFIFWFLERMISSETAKYGKKTKGILGIKVDEPILVGCLK